MENKKYSWYPENGNCPDIFDSIEEAIANAQKEFDNCMGPFSETDAPSIINIGTVRFFDIKNAVETLADSIEDTLYEQVHDFVFGCDIEAERYVTEKDKEAFRREATAALLPLIEKYISINPEWMCIPTGKYDLKNRKWVEYETI